MSNKKGINIFIDHFLLFGALLLGIMGLWISWGSLLLLEIEYTRLLRPLFGYGVVIYLLFACGKGKKWAILKGIVTANILAGVTGKYWETLYAAVIRTLPDVLERINNRYAKNYTLPLAPMMTKEVQVRALLWCSVLFLLAIGYGIVKRHIRLVVIMYVLPVLVSLYTMTFPQMNGLVMLCFSFGITLCYGRFKNQDMKAFKACCISLLLCGGILTTSYYGCLPLLDSWFDKSKENRAKYDFVVNEQWIPKARDLLQWDKWFQSSTVKGSLKRSGEEANDEEEVFRVTVDTKPAQTVYLRGFAGSTYTGISWKADDEKNLKRYYQEKGWELPKDYAQLYNTIFEKRCQGQEGKVHHMEIQEVSASNKYALYPYGAYLPDNGTVHADGVLKRKSSEYEFDFCPVENGEKIDSNHKKLSEEEEHYREYVYDTYLAYPAEELPRLTEYLESWNDVTDNVWAVSATVYYLGWNAVYNVNAPNTPEDEDFVEYFLFEGKEGWCAHFASSAVLILRKLGVPARYVTGYSASPDTFKQEADGTYTAMIQGKQAHAWAEIYLDGWGWVPLEVTPAAVAMTEDNRLEVLQTVGDMIVQQSEAVLPEDEALTRMPDSERVMDRIGISQVNLPISEKDSENETDEAKVEKDGDKDGKTEQEPSEQKKYSLTQDNNPVYTENSRKQEKTPSGWMRVLSGIVLAAGVVSLFCMIRRGSVIAVKSWYRKQKSTNEQVSWLYRRLQRMYAIVYGKENVGWKELGEDGTKEMERFICLVEKGTFAEGNLSRAECREAWRIYQRICKRVYESQKKLHRFVYRYIWDIS